MLIVLKSGSLSLLESSRSVQACNGIALPLTYKMQQTLTEASFYLLMVLFNWYTNILYCNKCTSFMTQFVSIKRSCIDTNKAVNRMYAQQKNSEDVGHFISSKTRPCLKVYRAPTACHGRSEPTSFSPSVPSMAT